MTKLKMSIRYSSISVNMIAREVDIYINGVDIVLYVSA